MKLWSGLAITLSLYISHLYISTDLHLRISAPPSATYSCALYLFYDFTTLIRYHGLIYTRHVFMLSTTIQRHIPHPYNPTQPNSTRKHLLFDLGSETRLRTLIFSSLESFRIHTYISKISKIYTYKPFGIGFRFRNSGLQLIRYSRHALLYSPLLFSLFSLSHTLSDTHSLVLLCQTKGRLHAKTLKRLKLQTSKSQTSKS
jgi:hypothetical protein